MVVKLLILLLLVEKQPRWIEMYHEGEYDLAGFAVGQSKKMNILMDLK